MRSDMRGLRFYFLLKIRSVRLFTVRKIKNTLISINSWISETKTKADKKVPLFLWGCFFLWRINWFVIPDRSSILFFTSSSSESVCSAVFPSGCFCSCWFLSEDVASETFTPRYLRTSASVWGKTWRSLQHVRNKNSNRQDWFYFCSLSSGNSSCDSLINR